jgi:hypothetical protein
MASKITNRIAATKESWKSKKSLSDFLQTPGHQESGEAATYNDDLLPTPSGQLNIWEISQ